MGGNFKKNVETLRATCAVRQIENVATLELFPFLRCLESNQAIILIKKTSFARGGAPAKREESVPTKISPSTKRGGALS